ncbi:MAG: hypothetical protein ACREVV_09120 [Steroidobacteraceae bacterium]
MALLVLRGNYTPEAWRKIKADPDAGPDGVQNCLEILGGTSVQYFYSLDQFDFYCFAEIPVQTEVVALRHLLFTQGSFSSLEGEPLLLPGELLPRLKELRARLAPAESGRSSR